MRRAALALAVLFPVCAYGQNPARAVKTAELMQTVGTIRPVSADSVLYEMDYTADYRLDDFLKSGIDSPQKLGKKAAFKLMKPFKAMNVFKEMKVNCSAFKAVTPGGDVIYARNFDYPHQKPAFLLVHCRPTDGYRSIGMSTMTFLGMHKGQMNDGISDVSLAVAAPYMTMDGMNEKGFAVSVLALKAEGARQTEKGKRSIMTSVAIRMMLDRAATVEEALELMRGYNFCANVNGECNYHFLLSDATGRAAVLEYVKKDGKWVMNVLDKDHVTNFYLTDGWQDIGGGKDRYEKLEKRLIPSSGVLSEREAMETLASVYQDGSGPNHSITQWSVVYNLTKGTATVSIMGDYGRTYRYADFE